LHPMKSTLKSTSTLRPRSWCVQIPIHFLSRTISKCCWLVAYPKTQKYQCTLLESGWEYSG
jgi:hypothetical protein